MFNGKKTITVINLIHDRTTDEDVISCKTLTGCSWFARIKASETDVGLQKSRQHLIRIPYPKAGYVSPDQWRGFGWTLKAGDKIVSGAQYITTAAEFASLKGANVCTIEDVHDNTRNPLPHWFIEGA